MATLSSFLSDFSFKKISSVFQKESGFLGIDIGSSSIKVVQLKKEKERAILQTYGELSMSGYADNGEIGKAFTVVDTKLTDALKDVLREAQVTVKRAAVSIPLKNSFLTTMDMPRLSDQELKEAIPYEARKYVPIPLSEAMIDWWVMPPMSTDSAASSIGSPKRDFVSVFLAAVPKEVVEKYESILKKVGLEVSGFEIEVFSFARSAIKRDLGSVLLIDLGASAMRLIIADGGSVRATHNVERGSQELSIALAQSLGINFDRAELLKRESGILHRPETEGVASVLEPLVGFFASEGERFLLDWKRKGGRPISRVVLGGGGALLKGIVDVMIKKYGVEAEIADPFSKVVYPAFLEPSLMDIGATFTNAIGLALRDF